MTPVALRQSLERAQAAQQQLRQRRVDAVLERLGAGIDGWLTADSAWMEEARRELPGASGFSAPMIAHGVPLLLAPLRHEAITALLDAELGDRHCLDLAAPVAGWLITHVLSGNIPGLGAAPTLLSLAIKRAALLKPAAGDPVFPDLLQRSLAAVDPLLGDCTVVAPWRGGDRACEDIAFAAASLVVAMGSDEALAAIAPRVPGHLIGHGHKISFAVIGRDALDGPEPARQVAAALAYDVALWDQQGCLSPQLAYVEAGGRVGIDELAEYLAESLQYYDDRLPPRRLSLDESAAIAGFRQAAEWGQHGSRRLLHGAGRSPWSLSIETEAAFLPTCLNRCLRLKSIADLDQMLPYLIAPRRWLEAAGVAVTAARRAPLDAALQAAGVHRVCALGHMQTPGLEWRQGGRPRVAEWLQMTELG